MEESILQLIKKKEKDGFVCSGLSRGYGGAIDSKNVLDSLLVPVQDENRGATGQDHDKKTRQQAWTSLLHMFLHNEQQNDDQWEQQNNV